jgi:hypothetical protein
VVAAAATALAEDGRVPKSTLSQMGLEGMEQLSDTQGAQVRGEGLMFLRSFASVKIGANPAATDLAVFQGSNAWQLETGAELNNTTSLTIEGLSIVFMQSQTAGGFARGRAW